MRADTMLKEIAECDREVALLMKSIQSQETELGVFRKLLKESKNKAARLRADLAAKLYQLSVPTNESN